jgi:hypothetical protein
VIDRIKQQQQQKKYLLHQSEYKQVDEQEKKK